MILAGKSWQGEFLNQRKDKSIFIEAAEISPIFDKDGNVTHFVAIKQDITEKRRAEIALQESEKRYRFLFERANDAIVIFTLEPKFVDANQKALDLFGYSLSELLQMENAFPLVDPAQRDHLRLVIGRLKAGETLPPFERIFLHKDGHQIFTEASPALLSEDLAIVIVRDITERKRLESELERLATTDPLTGALNRRELIRRAEIELERARRYGHPTSAIILDIDNFKTLNDTYGHPAGDKALVALAQLLTREIRAMDFAARYGGEEFMLILPETSLEKARSIAERIRRAVADMPVIADDQTIRFTISLGVTSSENVGQDFESLLKEADRLLYRAKQSGRNQVICDSKE
jgi:diguanylate cyclase (GGDEF)-like protein/PAS domain S-box-containing protein